MASDSSSPAKKSKSEVRANKPRRIKPPRYESFKLQKRIKPAPAAPMPSASRLFVRSLALLQRHWKLFLGIVAVYGLLNIVLVQGAASSGNVGEIKQSLDQAFKGQFGGLATSLSLFSYLLGTTGTSAVNVSGSGYQILLVVITSLALIWSLRQIYGEQTVRIRDGFYQGMTPFVPFVLVVCLIGVQLLPFIIGGALYNLLLNNAILVGDVERIIAVSALALLALASLYMLCASVFALYMVTLPDMTPLRAFRSAQELVRGRRWLVVRKLLFLPFILLVLAVIIMVPLILLSAALAVWVFFGLTLIGLAVLHSYVYALYRELL